jgi:hypothetical protein
MLVGGWQLNTLTAQARVERMAQRFGLVVIYPEVIEAGLPSVAPEPLATDQAEPVPSAQAYVPQKLGLEEAQQRTPFPIRLPTWLPSNLEMTALDVGEGGWGCNSQEECANAKPPVSVVVMYKTPGDTWNGIILQATEITPQSGGGYVVPAAGIQSVTMSGLPAIYVGGAAQGSTEDMDKMVWNAAVDQHMLSWEQDGLIYVLQASGLGFTREDVIRIAESLQPGG